MIDLPTKMRNAIAVFLTLQVAVLVASAESKPPESKSPEPMRHIVIDPGHGGTDTGAARGGVFESAIALAVAKQLAERLEKRGISVIMTRTKDETISLERRAALANQIADELAEAGSSETKTSAKTSLFLSIHLNSSTDPRAQGKEFYFQNQLPADEESLFLASRENAEEALKNGNGLDRIQRTGLNDAEQAQLPLQGLATNMADPAKKDLQRILADLMRIDRVRRSSELAKILQAEWRKSPFAGHNSSRTIRQAPFFLVSTIAMPSVLVEIGFLSHAREGLRLQRPDYQAALADSLAEGIVRYFDWTEGNSPNMVPVHGSKTTGRKTL